MEETKRPQFTIDLCGFQLHSIFLYQCENVLSIIADFQSHILFHLLRISYELVIWKDTIMI